MKFAVDIVNAVAAAVVAGLGLIAVCCALYGYGAVARRMIRTICARMERRIGKPSARVFAVLFCCIAVTGVTKFTLFNRSSSNDGIDIVSVYAVNMNDLTRIVAVSTNAPALPMWYRQSVSNDWTAALSDGWTLAASTYLPELGVYSNEWTRAEADFSPHAMYWFGSDPPAVEVVTEGGLYLDAWHATGRGVDVAWSIDDGVVLTDGSRVILEYGFGPGNAWAAVAECEVLPGGDRHGTLSVRGWFVGFATCWRLKLEVPR